MKVQDGAINQSMNAREWVLLLALSCVWGGSFFFNELALAELPPLTVGAGRLLIGAACLWAVIAFTRIAMPRDPAVWRAFFIMGLVANALPFSLILWGQTHIDSGLASILNATTPLFTVLLAQAMTADEKMSAIKLAGVVIGLCGVAVMIGAGMPQDGAVLEMTAVMAPLACLGAALAYGFAGVYGRRFRAMGVAPLATATGQISAAALLSVPAALFFDRPWVFAVPGATALAALICLGAISTALAYLIYFRLLASAGATNISLCTFLIPAVAILLGVFVLGEVMLPRHFVGMAMIGAGLAAIDGRIYRAIRARLRVPAAPAA